jgi:hypothetical protein
LGPKRGGTPVVVMECGSAGRDFAKMPTLTHSVFGSAHLHMEERLFRERRVGYDVMPRRGDAKKDSRNTPR